LRHQPPPDRTSRARYQHIHDSCSFVDLRNV